MKKTYHVQALTCANCALKIEEAFKKIDGVKLARVDLAAEKIYLEGKLDQINARDLETMAQTIEDGVKIFDEYTPDQLEDHYLSTQEWILYGFALAFMILGYILEKMTNGNVSPIIYVPFYVFSYVVFGGQVIIKAVKNIFKGQFFDENLLMTLATLGAFGIAEFVEAIAVMLFYRIGEHLQNRSVSESRRNIKELIDVQPTIAHLVTNQGIFDIDPKKLEVGQQIIIRPGEKVPVDGIITEGSSWLDTSSITGEVLPRDAYEGIEVISGSINTSGLITVQVQKKYVDSTVAKILDFVEHNASKKADAEKFISKFAKIYTPIVVLMALLLAFLVPLGLSLFTVETFGHYFPIYFERALIFLVISCPCALVLSIPLSFFAGIGAASRKGILFKSGSDLEMMSQIDHFVFDKTGTLTKGEFSVSATVSGEPELILEYAAHAEYHSNHPIAASLIKAYQKPLDESLVYSIREIAGKGVVANYKGIQLLVGNHKLLDDFKIHYLKTHEIGTIIYVVADKEYMGYIVIKDQVKESSKKMVHTLLRLGKKVTMVTGDYQTGAMDVSYILGIDDYYANCLPEDKVQIVSELSKDSKTAFIGDGMNDAPVLSIATLGIAMGGIGSDAAIEAADAVIMNDDPYQVIAALKISTKTMRIVYQNIVMALGVKLIVLVLGALGYANMWLAIFADVGVSILAVFNAIRIFKTKVKIKDKV